MRAVPGGFGSGGNRDDDGSANHNTARRESSASEELAMREDMFKVIVERPRRGGTHRSAPSYQRERRLARDDEGGESAKARETLRFRHRDNRKWLNENLRPLERWLASQVGRPWAKVYAELCAGIDRRSTVQQHVHQHIGDFVAVTVVRVDGELRYPYDWDGLRRLGDWGAPAMFVDPDSGLLRENRARQRTRRELRIGEAQARSTPPRDRRELDPRRQLHRREGIWYEVDLASLRGGARDDGHPAFDVLRHRPVRIAGRHAAPGATGGDALLYGRDDVYAWRRRQLCARELREHGLVNQH